MTFLPAEPAAVRPVFLASPAFAFPAACLAALPGAGRALGTLGMGTGGASSVIGVVISSAGDVSREAGPFMRLSSRSMAATGDPVFGLGGTTAEAAAAACWAVMTLDGGVTTDVVVSFV